jgi:diguanylate cyclase (GGDEF)-like protein
MWRMPEGERSAASLFAAYAAASLVLVVLLGVILASSYRAEAERRGIAEGLSEARLISNTAIEPLLTDRPLAEGLDPAQEAQVRRVAQQAFDAGSVMRLRLRDTTGHVVFSLDGSGTKAAVEDEAVEAAEGDPVALLTRLNSDDVDTGAVGASAVEVYLALRAGGGNHVVGVLETYLPYEPINSDVAAGMATLYRDLAIGLALLYVGIFLLAVSMSRGLRRQVRVNRHLAEFDQLTDLPNRAAFLARVKETVSHANADQPVAVAIIDLDRFKEVNDTLGHESGDDLLTEMARRLRSHLRGQDAVARLGGDEFGLVLVGAGDPERALWRVREVIEAETMVRGLPLSIASSIGYALAPVDGDDAEILLQRADVALYVAKSRHGGVMRYSSEHDHYDATKLALVGEMRRAIDHGELVLHYQPKVRLEDGSVESIEALVRWQHPEHGLLAPDRFVPLVEQTDLIDDLTAWVLDRALRDLVVLGPDYEDVAVAVNVSARSVVNQDLVTLVRRALERHEVSPSRLVIEITETALLVDPVRAASVLFDISDLGVSVSLDDFGVGQTSLSYLAALPIHEIKIDRSFVMDLSANTTHAAIARSITDLGRNLGVRVVAEGIELQEIADMLRALGCELGQGWLYARALPVDDLHGWLVGNRNPADLPVG